MPSPVSRPPIHFDPRAQGPLDGVRVLDLSRLVAGNMLSLQLADFGADVVKVEPPAGDPLRDWRDGGAPLHWKTYGRNKRSIVLNLRQPAAKQALLRLVARADVFIENYRPGTLEEMGLGPDVLLGTNPGFDHRARLRLRPDRPLRAAAGLRHAGRGHERACGAHRLCGSRAGAAAAGARRHDRGPLRRLRDRDGACARASGARRAARSSISRCSNRCSRCSGRKPRSTGRPAPCKERTGSGSHTSAPRNVYRCADGKYVAISGSTETMARRIFRAIGRADMIDDARFPHQQRAGRAPRRWSTRRSAAGSPTKDARSRRSR